MNGRPDFEDNRLDVVVLGPMGKQGKASSEPSPSNNIGKAVKRILKERATQKLLKAGNTTTFQIHIPEEWRDSGITNGVLSRIDIADLVIVNITPADGPAAPPSANVYYELGLVHAMGLPFIILCHEETTPPFYLRDLRNYEVAGFSVQNITNVLRAPIQQFLNRDDDTDFTDNRVSQFYDHLPLVDISAAVGLATGYYHNFVGRMLREGSFISEHPHLVKRLIVVRPSNVLDTFEADQERLRDVLASQGLVLRKEELPEPQKDKNGGAWIFHVDGIVIDLPRMIYPLKKSPRLVSMQDRFDHLRSSTASAQQKEIMLRQASERLLNRIEHVILFHVRRAETGYRKNLLHFARIDEVPGLLRQFGAAPPQQ